MCARLQAALDALLGDRAVCGRPDAERLAVVVLLAKGSVGSSKLTLRAGEMARWLGIHKSYVLRKVLPGLRGSGVVSTDVMKDSHGYVDGLKWELLPLTAALDARGGPLVLDKGEAATFLRFCERLFGPGWAPVGKAPTPPGLLAGRRGRGAATARLALVQLALRARPEDGRVRLVGGAVKGGHRRAAATIARLLRCEVEDAEQVLDDLILEEVVTFEASSAKSGAGERLVIPAVADACGRAPEAESSEVLDGLGEAPGDEPAAGSGCATCGCSVSATWDGAEMPLEGDGWVQESFDVVDEGSFTSLVGALRDQSPYARGGNSAQTGSDLGKCATEGEEPASETGALHHAPHTPLVEPDGSLSLSGGFSGEADQGNGGLPERACTREDGPDRAPADGDAADFGSGSPLRGEQQQESAGGSGQHVEQDTSRKAARRVNGVVFVRPAPLPAGLELVLAPVQPVWERIVRLSARRHVAAAVRGQLGLLGGIVGPQLAERVLAERLGRRLDQQMGRPVTDPVGWILGRGLVQRAWCWARLCDEGRRMDTGADCPSCEVVIGDRRGLRARIAEETARELAGAAPKVLQAETERRLHSAVASEAAVQAARREQAAVMQQARAQAAEQRRVKETAAEQERLVQPCADCGVPDAAGRCPLCAERRSTARALAEAVDLAVMTRADLTDPAAVAEATRRCALDTQALLEQHLDRLHADGVDENGTLFAARETAVRIRDRRRQSLHSRLMCAPEAEAEANRAYDATMRGRHRYPVRTMAEAAAERAADEAQLRAADFLFGERARQLRVARGEQPSRPASTDWASRCAELAGRELGEDGAEGTGARVRKTVNAA
ncbi:hypothetical protein AB0J01_28085 [Streptomyces sp. NPDC050204]|uniref:hypothetical protein n=1 Tax=Streptomyces sp. NPDC050204 TaxID=3155514 RepID=UPI003446980D